MSLNARLRAVEARVTGALPEVIVTHAGPRVAFPAGAILDCWLAVVSGTPERLPVPPGLLMALADAEVGLDFGLAQIRDAARRELSAEEGSQ